MNSDRHVTLYHSPQSRSVGVLVLLEELGADYETYLLDLKKGEQRQASYLAINPMGKVPAIKHGDAIVTEQVAIYQYLAELYPEAGLAPAVGSPLRGPFLRWLAFYGASFEPALMDKAAKHPPASPGQCPYGDFDTMFNTLHHQLEKGPYILGEQFSAADILWANALRWTTMFQLVPATPVIQAYINHVTSRPAAARAAAKDAQVLAARDDTTTR
ncbi:MAG: glutathione S-transferase [Rubrivivax sp.]|nr:MAG: glutathione S-transferase [Rubrivivax sp.]